MNIEIISGSPRKESVSYRVALHLKEVLTSKTEHNIGLIDVRDHDLGLLQNVFSTVEATPDKHKELAKRIFAADAFVLVTPEYNGSYSPALQNVLDHFPKQSRKVFGVVTSSPGAMGGMRASQKLLTFIPGLFGIASPHMLVIPAVDKKFDAEGKLLDENFEKSVNNFVSEFIWLAESVFNNKK